jgi:hypothetical protein
MEQLQNKIDEKLKMVEATSENLKGKSDMIRLIQNTDTRVDGPLTKELKMNIISELLNIVALLSENISTLHREIATLMNESIELFKKDTAEKFRDLDADIKEGPGDNFEKIMKKI